MNYFKTIGIAPDLHYRLKNYAARKQLSMVQVIRDLMDRAGI